MQRLREPLQTDWQFSAVTSSPESQHEFYRTLVELNELLSAVVTFGESLLDVQLPDKARQYAEEIFQYATRAEDVASLLLDLSPGWTVPTTVADVDTVLESMATTLRTLIGRGVELGIRLNAPSACVPVDRIQLEWLIINLVAYIRHATKLDTRRLVIESDHVEISAEHPVFSLRPGTYVRLGLAGHGGSAGDSGRESSSITSVFLSTAESIVMESGGAIQVETNAGEDRRFMILLPTTYTGEHQ
jgi:hypothetical protein